MGFLMVTRENSRVSSLTGPGDEYLVIVDSKSQTNKNQNYQGDYLDMNIQSITTSDLVYWAYQIARGMEYLANRKVK